MEWQVERLDGPEIDREPRRVPESLLVIPEYLGFFQPVNEFTALTGVVLWRYHG
jgi:hypothetical protein